jgi:hypothetical protein
MKISASNVVIAVIAVVVLVPIVLRCLGFTQRGISAGSPAAFAQSYIGYIAPRSLFAKCQSIGVNGVPLSIYLICGSLFVYSMYHFLRQKRV